MRTLFIRIATEQFGTPAQAGVEVATVLRELAQQLEAKGVSDATFLIIKGADGRHLGHLGHEDDSKRVVRA